MKRIFLLLTFFALAFLFTGAGSPDKEWTVLLDKNLSHWEIYQSYEHKNGYNGKIPKNEQGEDIQPIGYNKNVKNVFSIIEENGQPVLKISGETYGCVFTKDEFENYHMKLKVRWGDKKWEPRLEKLKDSGVLYHSIGECGAEYWRSWMLSQEFQIMEGHMGDYWTQASSAIDIKAFIPEGTMNPVASEKQPFLQFGGGSNNGGFCLRSVDYESPRGEWNQIELICFEGKSLHIVNGKVVMILQNSRYTKDGKSFPLTKGKIQLQSEATEVYYKDILIKKLAAMPGEYTSYFSK